MQSETFSERIFKVNTRADSQRYKYVFVGKTPDEVASSLKRIHSPDDLVSLSKQDTKHLRDYYGEDWQFKLGISGKDEELSNGSVAVADRLYFVEDFRIRYDDNIKMVRHKIYLVCSHLDFYIRPEWQHLYTSNGKNLSTDTFYASHEINFSMSSNPLKELDRLTTDRGVSKFAEAILSQKSRVTDVQDALLHDYCPIEHDEIFMVTVQEIVAGLLRTRASQLVDVQKLFLSRYFPHIKKWSDVLNNRLDLVQEGKRDRQPIQDYVLSDDNAIVTLESRKEYPSLQSSITSLSVEVELDNLRPGNEAKIDLEKVFDHTEVDHNLILVSFRGNSRDIPARHKLKKDMQILKKDITSLKQWLNPTDESGKVNTLTMRFRAIDDLGAILTLTLLNSGAYKMGLRWPTEQAATTANVSACINFAKDFIERKILPTPYLLDRLDTFQMPLPCSPFIGSCDSLTKNVVIKNMHQKLLFPASKDFLYHGFKRLAYCFKPYITVSSETGEISSFWARFPRSNVIIAKLVEKNLYDLPALSELSPEEWQNLQLFTDPKTNTQYVEEFRNKVNSLTSKKIAFFFTRHSKNNNPNVYKKIINDFVNPRNLKLNNLGEDPVQLQALLKELSQRLGMSKKDAYEVFQDYVKSDAIDLISPKVSTGPKCELKRKNDSFKLTITNLRDYTKKSSISYLSKLITSFFGKFIELYEDDDVETFLKSNKALCSTEFIQDVGIETDLQSITPEEDDDDFFDFDFDVSHEKEKDPVSHSVNESVDDDLTMPESNDVSQVGLKHSEGKSRLDRLKARDKDIFTGKQKPGFASRCKVKRQPVILTRAEYESQDKTAFKTPAALPGGFQYREHYYICPEFWCPRLGKAVHAKDLHDITWNYTYDNGVKIPSVASAKCADGEFAEVATDGISGWKANGLGGRYEYPGFLTDHYSDDKKGVPCCFGTDQSVTNDTASFYRLLNNTSKIEDEPTKISSQRYRLGANKTPVVKGRYGKLIPNLDLFFNGNIDPSQKIYDENFNRFLRFGIAHDDNSFLGALMTVVNLSARDLFFKDTAAFRAYIASNLDDDLLFRSLKNGNLKIIFEDYPGDDYLAKFRRYIEFEEDLESEYLWDLFCRPIPWLFPEGVNLFVLTYKSSDDDATLKCPLGEIITNFYHANKEAAFIVTDGKFYEPIVQINNSLAHRVIFPSSISYARLEKHFPECRGRPRGTMIPFFVLDRLLHKGSVGLQPKLQIVNTYNKVRYIVTQNSSIIPVEQGYGPVHEFGIPLGSIDQMPQMTYAHFKKILPEFVDIFYPDCVPHKILLDENGRPAAFRLQNDFVVPIKFSSGDIPYPIDEQWLFRELDDDIFDRPYFVDERVKLVSEFFFLRESLERYRHELANFLQVDMEKPVDNKISKKYLLRIKSVLDAKDKSQRPLPVWAKRTLLEDIFFKPAKANLVSEIIDTRKESIDVDYTLQTRRSLCSSKQKSHKTLCNVDAHCTWQRQCKMYLPKKYVSTFTMLVIEELLRDTVGREMIFENRLETLIKTKRIEVKANHILFDDTVSNFVLDIMEKFDLRKEKERSIIDYLEPSTMVSRNHLQNLKKNILFRGFMKFPQQPLGVQAKLIAIDSSQKNTLYYTAVSNSLYNTIAYVIADVMNRPQFDSDQLRQDIVRSLKPSLEWQDYLKRLRKIGGQSVQHIDSFAELASFIEETDWGGSIIDVDIVSRIYPVDFRLVGVASKRRAPNDGPVVKLFAISPTDIRLVYQKIDTNLSFRQIGP